MDVFESEFPATFLFHLSHVLSISSSIKTKSFVSLEKNVRSEDPPSTSSRLEERWWPTLWWTRATRDVRWDSGD